MGILNVTPDSFSDGGRYDTLERALERGLDLVRQGADILDIGGESTRPGASRVARKVQMERVLPVIGELRRRLPAHIALSVDTTLSTVAAAAIDQGATLINDVSAGRDDPAMLHLAAESGARLVLMHMRGTPQTMQQDPVYQDVVAEVEAFLLARAAAALEAGVRREALILDPGIGFGKTRRHNLLLLQALPRLCALGLSAAARRQPQALHGLTLLRLRPRGAGPGHLCLHRAGGGGWRVHLPGARRGGESAGGGCRGGDQVGGQRGWCRGRRSRMSPAAPRGWAPEVAARFRRPG